MSKTLSLGVIVPFYNEEKYLEKSISRLLQLDIVNQIVLVDDFSTDSSYAIAENISNKNSDICLTQTSKNSGKGAAVKKGLDLISTTHVIVHDADLEYFPEDIPEMFNQVDPVEDCLVLGSRTLGTKERTNLYFFTYFGNKVLTILFSILNNRKLSDIASCYWLVKVESLKKINLSEKGFTIEVEVLSKFIENKINIVEVPIKYHARSYADGKKIKFKDGMKILVTIIKYSKVNFFK
jgi:glycosyltransferase involved in cell wall biosynthesis